MLKQHCSENQRFSFSESSMLTRKPCVNESTNQVLQQNCREISLLSEGISLLSVIPIFDAQFFFEIFMPFPGEAKTPKSTESAGKQLLTAHGILECSQTCAASCFCWWLPLSHNEHGCWQKKKLLIWLICVYIYIQMDRVDMSTWLLAKWRKHEYHNFAQFDSSAHWKQSW